MAIHNPVTIQGVDSSGNNIPIVVNGDGSISSSVGAGNGVIASDYDADKATSTTSARETIPTGAESIWVANMSITSTEVVRFRFGDSSVTATATTGFRLGTGVSTAVGDAGPVSISVPVPTSATHWAYVSIAGTPTINVVWGG